MALFISTIAASLSPSAPAASLGASGVNESEVALLT